MLSHQRKTNLEDINVSKTFQMKNVNEYFQFNLHDHEKIPVITYKLTGGIMNKYFS